MTSHIILSGLPAAVIVPKLIFNLRSRLKKVHITKFWIKDVYEERGTNLKSATLEFYKLEDTYKAFECLNGYELPCEGQRYPLTAKITVVDRPVHPQTNRTTRPSDQQSNKDIRYEPERYRAPNRNNDGFPSRHARSRSRSPLHDDQRKVDLELEMLRKKRMIIEEERKLLIEKKKLELLRESGNMDRSERRIDESEWAGRRPMQRSPPPQRRPAPDHMGSHKERRPITPEYMIAPQERKAPPQERRAPPVEYRAPPQGRRAHSPVRMTAPEDRRPFPQERRPLTPEYIMPPQERRPFPQERRPLTPEYIMPPQERRPFPQERRPISPQRMMPPPDVWPISSERAIPPDDRRPFPRERRAPPSEDRAPPPKRRPPPERRRPSPQREALALQPKYVPKFHTPPKKEKPPYQDRLPNFYTSCNVILGQMRNVIKQITPIEKNNDLYKYLRIDVRKRLTQCVGTERHDMDTKAVVARYREIYPEHTDEYFVKDTLLEISQNPIDEPARPAGANLSMNEVGYRKQYAEPNSYGGRRDINPYASQGNAEYGDTYGAGASYDRQSYGRRF